MVLQNAIRPADGEVIAAATPNAKRIGLPYHHLQLLADRDAIADVAARFVSHLRATEKEAQL
jgi:hypothetical protein